MKINKIQSDFEKELQRLETQFQADKCDAIEEVIAPLEPNIIKNGRVNVWWMLWNLGKMAAQIVFATKIGRR